MTNVTLTLEGELEPVSVTVYDGVFVDSGAGGGGAVDSVNGHTGTVVLAAADVGAQPADSDLTAIAALTTTTFGRSLLTAADAAAARTLTGAGTSSLALGTTSSTAKAGDYQPTAANISDATTIGRTVLTAADAAAIRTALGLGTAATTAATAYDAAGAAASAQAASQPLDSDLTAIAALSTTTFGRSLLTAADAAAARSTLGAGTSSFDGVYSSLTSKPTLGTSAAKDIPATGDASTSQVVYGTDSRLTDARTPSAHASSHASAGSDPVTLAASQIGSGTVATARLGSGTADSTKFLRGDQSWAVPGGGGTVTSVTAGDATITVGGTAADPTVAVNAIAESKVTNLVTDLAAKAPLASPTFTGTPAAPTAAGGTNTTQVATTAFVASAVSPLAPLASPTFTGHPVGVTEAAGNNSTRLATTAYVDTADALSVAKSTATTKGDLFVATASATIARQAVGTDGYALVADSAQTNGIKYKALDDSDVAPVTVNDQTASYTFVLADKHRMTRMSNASATTATIPPNSSVAFAIGTTLTLAQQGAGQCTWTAGAGVTIRTPHGAKTSTQYTISAATKVATDEWYIAGDTST